MADEGTQRPIRAVVVTAAGGIDVLEVREVPRPRPGPGEIAVEVLASGVNFIDVYRREGVYPVPPPFVLGSECAGRVIETGSGVTGFAVGDLVATESGTATHAQVTVLAADRVVRVPPGVDADVAAAVMLQGLTAHYLTTSTFPLRGGEDVLVHAAAGGVGQLLVQLATAAGARVVATVGSAAKADIAHRLGAATVLRYDEIDAAELAQAVRAAAPSGGVHVAYDGVGAATFDASLAALHRRGMLVLYGASSGQVPPFELQRLRTGGSLFVTRPTLGDYTATPEELMQRAEAVFDAVAAGALRVQIGGRYPLDRAADAYRDLEGRHSTGKLLIVP
jgi:NADPH2:quinone reductase